MKSYTKDDEVTVNGAMDGQRQKAVVLAQTGDRVRIRYANTGTEAEVSVYRVKALVRQ